MINCRRSFVVDTWSTVYRKLAVYLRMDKRVRYYPLGCCHKITACRAEVKVRMPLPDDAAGPAQCPCPTLMCVTL